MRIKILNIIAQNWLLANFAIIMPLLELGLLCGCSSSEEHLFERALNMVDEKRAHELQQLLEHNSKSKLQKKAVKWIICNMPFNYTLNGKELDKYHHFYRLFSEKGEKAMSFIDSIQNTDNSFHLDSIRAYNDIKHIDLERLNEDIKLAFNTYKEMPWSVNVTEEDFIRYVLPYRIEDERFAFWRGYAYEIFRDVIDSLKTRGCDDPLTAAQALMNRWNRIGFRWTGQLPSGPALGISNITQKAGACREFAHGVVYIMRAAGIPSGIDMVPIRGENSAGHMWPFIIGKDRLTYVTSTENPNFIPASEFDIVAAKIYRTEFAPNFELDHMLPSNRDMRPEQFYMPKISDVTTIYKPGKCMDVEFENIVTDKSIVYLASWGNNQWVAVDCSNPGTKVRFNNVSGGVISVVAQMSNGNLEAISAPFEIMTDERQIRTIRHSATRKILTAYAKFPLNMRNGDLVERCIGGVIEGDNNPNFSHPDTIFQIRHMPIRRLNFHILPHPSQPYRYFRYVGSEGSYCNIAEVSLYKEAYDEKELKGSVFGTPGSYNDDPAHDFHKVFDGDIFSSFDYKTASGGWAAIDLGHPVSINKIMFVPRNRDNYVRVGDEYELFWFGEYKWHSAGRKMAYSDSLDFEVPTGALYYLKNHSRGRSERIFEYDFNRRTQHFW